MYAIDGSWNATTVNGLSYTGLYSATGSINIIAATGLSYCGAYHPCGALWTTTSTSTGNRNAPDGSLYVNTTGLKDGSQRVTAV